jgi:hypothetical protein
MLRNLVLALAIAGVPLPGLAASPQPFEIDSHGTHFKIFPGKPATYLITKTAPWAQMVRVMGRNRSDNSCETIGYYEVELTKPAAHGSVCTRREQGSVAFNNQGAAPKCLGQGGIFVEIYYQPDEGFVGVDAFEFKLRYKNEPPDTEAKASLTITPASDGASGLKIGPAPKLQDLGLLPTCRELVM